MSKLKKILVGAAGGTVVLALAGSVLISVVALRSKDKPKAEARLPGAEAVLMDGHGKQVGLARFSQLMKDGQPEGVLVSIAVDGLAPGEAAFHIHETGMCDAAGGFASAGGHFNPHGKAHGVNAEGGAHAGDMPNLVVTRTGRAQGEVVNREISLVSGPGNILDADGSALVIHAKADDYVSQPAGDAGGRVVCGVIRAVSDTGVVTPAG